MKHPVTARRRLAALGMRAALLAVLALPPATGALALPPGTPSHEAAPAAQAAGAASTSPTPTLAEQCDTLGKHVQELATKVRELQQQIDQSLGARAIACSYSTAGGANGAE